MPIENVSISEVFIGSSDGAGTPAASVAVDTTTTAGSVAVGNVTIEDVRHVVVLTVYPAGDVSSLNTSSLGSSVRNTLLSVV